MMVEDKFYLIIRWKDELEYDHQTNEGGLRSVESKCIIKCLVLHQKAKHHETQEGVYLKIKQHQLFELQIFFPK